MTLSALLLLTARFAIALALPTSSETIGAETGGDSPVRCAPMAEEDVHRFRPSPATLASLRLELRKAIDDKLPAGGCASPAPVVHWVPPPTRKPTSHWHGRNFGDDLNLDLWAAILRKPRAAVPHVPLQSPFGKAEHRTPGELLLVGSLLEDAVSPRDVVAGAGIRGMPLAAHAARILKEGNVTVAAVRGRYSLAALEPALWGPTPALGDPGLFARVLVPSFFDITARGGGGLCAIVHGRDAVLGPAAGALNFTMIGHDQDPADVARAIAGCDLVVSSSLHGLIFSDALGVPSVLFSPLPDPALKYWDYASSLVRARSERHTLKEPGEDLRLNRLVGMGQGAWMQPDLHAAVRACRVGSIKPRISFKQLKRLAVRYVQALPLRRLCEFTAATHAEKVRWWDMNLLGPHSQVAPSGARSRQGPPSADSHGGS